MINFVTKWNYNIHSYHNWLLSSSSRVWPFLGPPCWLWVKNPPASAGDTGSIPGLGRSPREGNGSPLQHSCLENPVDRGAWRVTVHGVTESDTTEQLSTVTKLAEPRPLGKLPHPGITVCTMGRNSPRGGKRSGLSSLCLWAPPRSLEEGTFIPDGQTGRGPCCYGLVTHSCLD